jgi:transporter family-2 protein
VSAFAALLSLLAGLSGSVQAAVMGRFGQRVGVFEALAFASALQALLTFAIVLAVRQSVSGYVDAVRQPPWLWLGGVMGAFIVLSVTFATPRIGTAATIGLLIAGQLAMGVLIDAFGLFGLERIPLNTARLVGLVLLAGGSVLVLKR